MHERALQLCYDVKEAHKKLYEAITTLREFAGETGSMLELADIAYSLHVCEKFVVDSKKELGAFRTLLDRLICAIWTETKIHEPIRTAHVTCSPDIKMMAKIPSRHKDPEGFKKLMEFLGLDRELWDKEEEDHLPIHIHYPGMIDYLSNLAAQGRPLPDGVDPGSMYPVYKTRLRPRKEIVAPPEGYKEVP